MKKTANFSKRTIAVLFALFTFAFVPMQSQIFIPPTASETIDPPGVPSGTTPHCYSHGSIYFGGSSYDILMSAIDGQVIWQMTNPGTPLPFVFNGTIAYPGCQDMSVGFNYGVGGQPIAIVCYYKPGTGHFYDVYNWTATGIAATPFLSTQVSTLPYYTRISMDSHKAYGIVIVWEDFSDIRCVTGLSGVWSPVIQLGGTIKKQRPDVAFSHAGPLNVHFVYNLQTGPSTFDIYESVADFYTLNSSLFYTPTVEDINTVSAQWSNITASIDAPDHYSVDNWAYTYATDGADIYTRTMDYNSSLVPVTTNVVNGSLGNASMWGKELGPRIAYNQSATSYHVAWYSSYIVMPYGQCYFTEQIKENGITLISSPDYELVAANSMFPPGASLNSFAFSKQNDATSYLYAVFLDNAGVHHAFHQWPITTSFRSSSDGVQALADACNAQHASASSAASLARKDLAVGPNPFNEHVNLYIPASLKDENMSVKLMDISGKLLLNYEGPAGNAPAAIERASSGLTAGTYLLNTSIKSANLNQNFKLQCAGTSER